MYLFHSIKLRQSSFSQEQLAITGNLDHVGHDEDMSDRIFVDTTCVCGPSKMARGSNVGSKLKAEEAPAGVGERGSNLEREEMAKEVARVT